MNSTSDGRGARLQHLLERLVSKRDIPHAVVAVECMDGSYRWSGAAGVADAAGTPMRADTPFYIASIDKLYTASAILKLRERGAVDLDQPVRTYLPPALTTGIHRIGGIDYSDGITVRHLLGHTSGLPDHIEDRPRGGKSLVERLVAEGDRSWTIEEAIALVRDLTPYFPPQPAGAARQKARYSDTNYLLLVAIVEVVSGRPRPQAFEEMLLGPLGLHNTFSAGGPSPPGSTAPPAALWAGSRWNFRWRCSRCTRCSAPPMTCCGSPGRWSPARSSTTPRRSC